MKCIQDVKNPERVERVTNEKAEKAVKSGLFQYVPKSVWKETGRH